jgi:hypothetical protein
MKSVNDVKKFFKNAAINTNPNIDEAVFNKVLMAHKTTNKRTAANELNIGRTIMKNPIIKLSAAALIIAVVVLGLFEFKDTDSTTGIVWAEVLKKVEASRGSVVRCREKSSFQPSDETDYTMKYYSPTHSRTDHYEGGHITYSYYEDFDTMTITAVFHPHKHYIIDKLNDSGPDFFLEKHEHWMNPRYLVQRVLAGEHKNLGQKTIDGVLCEGIETTDPAALGPLPGPINNLEIKFRLWVDVQTKYPVLFESKMSGEAEGKSMESEWILDEFQWDVELEPSFLEPNIPPDYVDMRTL